MNAALRRAQPWLGTMVEVGLLQVAGDPDRAFSAAFAAVARVHDAMSPQRPQSDLARFNAAPAGSEISCDPWTLAVLGAARDLGEASRGVFDVSLGSGGDAAWGLRGDRLFKLRDGVRLDLGGIAKGEAVDCACEALLAAGVAAGWVNAGGDLRVFGALALPVQVRHPGDARRLVPLVEVREGAVASSVFDRAVYPSARHRAVSVAAPRCRWADALTKVLALAPETGMRLLPRYDARAWLDPHLAAS